jgi:hypothetical protein
VAAAFTTVWCASEHSKRVTAVRWHPDAVVPGSIVGRDGGGGEGGVSLVGELQASATHPVGGNRGGGGGRARFGGWLGATAADGTLLVYGTRGETLRSAPPCRQGLSDLSWRPRSEHSGRGCQDLPL